jgi:flagella basal body P-ring formation protein FlgA
MTRPAALLALLLAAQPCPAATPQNPDALAAAIRQAAAASAPPGATLTLGPLTGASVMPACPGPLSVSLSGIPPYEQAAAHCPALGWTLYVTLTVAQTATIAIAARPLAAGQPLTAADLRLAPEPVASYAGRQVFYDPAALLGASPTLPLPAGAILTADLIEQPLIVKAGQTLTVSVVSGAVQLSLTAIADQSGRIGDMILLTNPASGRRFSALVTASGPVLHLQS